MSTFKPQQNHIELYRFLTEQQLRELKNRADVKVQFLQWSLEVGFNCEAVPIDFHVGMFNFTAEINIFT